MSHEAYDRVGPFYLQYYSTQRGRGAAAAAAAGPRIFRGGDRWRPRQRGDGFGSFLRGIARFLLPVVGSGISTFASHTLDAADRGVSLGDAAKSALKPTLRAVVDAGRASSSSSLLSQGGDGKQNFYKRMLEAKRRKRQHKRDGNDDDGGDGPPTKRRKHKRKRGSSSSSKPGKQQGRGGGGIVTKRRKQRGRGRGKPKKKQQQRQGGRGLSKKRVYKTSTAGSFNF